MKTLMREIIQPESFILDPSLVLYLPLYELDGSPFMSQDAYGHLCTVTGALWTPDGRAFDGSDDRVNCGSASSLDNLTEFTWLIWVYHDNNDSLDKLFDKNRKRIFINTNRTVRVLIDSAGTTAEAITIETVSDQTWTLIELTYSHSGDKKPYITLQGIAATYSTQVAADAALTSDAGDDLLIGSGVGGSTAFDGQIGEALIYNRVLPPFERQQNYLATKWRYR